MIKTSVDKGRCLLLKGGALRHARRLDASVGASDRAGFADFHGSELW